MKELRICSSYPSDMTVDHPAIKAVYFVSEEVWRISDYNRTHHREDETSGCVQRVINNQSDLVSNLIPLSLDLPHLKHFIITNLASRTIVSAYVPVTSLTDTSVFSSVSSFSTEIYVSVLLIFYFIYLFFMLHRKINSRVRSNDLICLIGVSLHQYFMQPTSNSLRIVTLTIVVLFFYTHFYFGSFIKTELVTLNHADIISSYDDIIRKTELKAKWISYELDYQYFRDADQESIKKKIWNKSQPDPLIELTQEAGTQIVKHISNRTVVFIGTAYVMNLAYAGLCPVARFMHLNPMIMRSANDVPEGHSSGYSDRLEQSVAKILTMRAVRAEGSGITAHLLATVKNPLGSEMNNIVGKENLRICSMNHVEEEENIVPDKILSDLTDLFNLCGYAILLSIAAIAFESISSRYFRRRKECT